MTSPLDTEAQLLGIVRMARQGAINDVTEASVNDLNNTQWLDADVAVERIMQLFTHHQAIVAIDAKIEELELHLDERCICAESGIIGCDSLWHHNNNIKDRIISLEQQKATLLEEKV